MLQTDLRYRNYISILEEELRPAMGCTEPIAIAYAAAMARKTLGVMPERLLIEASGNIIKNVKSVVVPHTGGPRGIPAAAAAGVVAGDADAELEVLAHVTPEDIRAMSEYLRNAPIEVKHADTGRIFDIRISAFSGGDCAVVRIADYHTNLVLVSRNDDVLIKRDVTDRIDDRLTDRTCLSVEGIVDFADSVDVEDVKALLERQIDYNMAIAKEGLSGNYG
ncbi:MAG: serine dehydratase subunit alpha family protein, partial [Clostridia bacterium]|nr:serine dehydratase subunit alpha family protein [Clostridia bacterium]